jgi:hypothetical protein
MPIFERQATLVFFTTPIRRKLLKTFKPKVKVVEKRWPRIFLSLSS